MNPDLDNSVWGSAFEDSEKEKAIKKNNFLTELGEAGKHFSRDSYLLEEIVRPYLEGKTFPRLIHEIMDEHGVLAGSGENALYPLESEFQQLHIELKTGEVMIVTTDVVESSPGRFIIQAIDITIDLRQSPDHQESDLSRIHIIFPYDFSATKNWESYYLQDEDFDSSEEPFDSSLGGAYYGEIEEHEFCLNYSLALMLVVDILKKFILESK